MNDHPIELGIDPVVESQRIIKMLKQTIFRDVARKGAVVGISGGVDSSVVLALCVKAFSPLNVTALMLPEKDSSPESLELARQVAGLYGVDPILEDITASLEGAGCYQRRDEAVKRLFPEYDPDAGYKVKISLPPNLLEEGGLNVFHLTIITPEGEEKRRRLPPREFFQIVAASNFKQRTRMSMLYYHAELRNYAVVGTGNRNEHEQGFFVKYGDGGVDLQPIAHLYKTEVYQLAEYLEVPAEIRLRPPTSDTYSAPSNQQEFFFRLPFEVMDQLWHSQEQQRPVEQVARQMKLSNEQVQRAYDDFTRKKRTTEYLRMPVVRLDRS
ncbi:MAG: NAD(+) synthase [Anaerolineales bacterium]